MRFPPNNLPPAFDVAAVDERAGEVRRLYAEHDERRKLATEAGFAVERAEQSDAEARAAAIRAGKTSKPNAAEKARKALEDAEREETAYAEAVRQAEADLRASIEQHADELRNNLHEAQSAAREGMRSALDALETHRGELARALALLEWVEIVESGGTERSVANLEPAAAPFRTGKFASRLPDLGPSGEPLHVAVAIDGLRSLVTGEDGTTRGGQPERAPVASGG